MYLTPYRPHFGLKPQRRSTFFDDFFTPMNSWFEDGAVSSMHPAVDIYEKDDKLVFEAELPGIEKDKINVDVKGNLLTLSGEHSSDEESRENGHYRRERKFGKFERTFKLPFEVREEHIDASYKDGVLKLTVDRPEEQKPKQITIN
ncbi:MAG: Hsp20/alpha crystallin family protein [Desulfofustis sp.]|jgi:HSP20 family protein